MVDAHPSDRAQGEPPELLPIGEPPELLPIKSRSLDFERPIWGTYLVTGRRAQRGYRLSKFCMAFMQPEHRESFRSNPDGCMVDFGLSAQERELVQSRDWNGMLRYGVSPFMIFKLSSACGVGQSQCGAQMRGQSLEEFLATRNVPDAR